MLSALADTDLHGRAEVIIAPAADPGVAVGRDVGRVQLAHVPEIELAPAGKLGMAGYAVTADTVTGLYQVFAALDGFGCGGHIRVMRHAHAEGPPGDEHTDGDDEEENPESAFHDIA